MAVGDGLIGDTGRARGHEIPGLGGIGGEVQVGIEDLPLAQHRALTGLGFLDLDDHVGGGKDLLRRIDDRGARGAVGVILGPDSGPGPRLDHDLMAMRDHLFGAFGRYADAVFVVLDFLRASDLHGAGPPPMRELRVKYPRNAGILLIFS